MTTQHYDGIVIGSGQAGGPLATTLAKAGWSIAIIEREHVGGTCVNVGCTPTKTMVASARVAYLTNRSTDYGVHTGEHTIDMTVVRQRKRAIVESFRSGSENSLRQTEKLDWLTGEARFVGPKTVEVTSNDGEKRQLSADNVFINVGERTAIPQLDGLDSVPYLTSTTIMELDAVPEHLIIIGGGYIGLEFGQMFRRFGSNVTIVQRGAQLLAREDADIADAVATILREDGINVLLNTSTKAVNGSENNIQLVVQGSDGETTIHGSHLLVAVGRRPNTDALGLEQAGIATNDKGYITVNDQLETNVAGVYALGDVKGGPAFTHISYDDFRILRTNLLQGGGATTKARMVPYTVFIDPQLGRVGVNEQEARKAGKRIKIARMPMTHVARALEVDESRGTMKAIVDADTDMILGCAMLGIEGGELMSMIQLAMMGNLTASQLRDGVFAHPTLAESLNNLFTTIQDD